ncbi:MAG: hypothetical protein ACLFR1_13310 [Spirochaetia bacterium]
MKKSVFQAILFLVFPAMLFCELPPDAYNRWVEESDEVLIIHIDDVTTANSSMDITDVLVSATVLYVCRSNSGLSQGDAITIEYEGRRVFPDHPGPALLGVLEETAVVPAYLNRRSGVYVPGARGRSFSTWVWPSKYGSYEECLQSAMDTSH